MIEAVEDDYKDKEEELHNFVAGIAMSFTGAGESLGPILGSSIAMRNGFRYTQQTMCFIVAAYFFLYVVFTFKGRLSNN